MDCYLMENIGDKEHKLVIGRLYIYCPWCATELVELVIDGKTRRKCPRCDFVYYRNPIPAAGAIVEKDGKILLVKRKYPPYVGDWCLPAGFMEYNESPEQCCVREIKEETGLTVNLKSSFKTYSGDDDPRSHAVLVLYLADITGGDIEPGDDASEVKFFAMDKLPRNIAFEAHRRAISDYIEFKNSGKFPKPNE
ncbi:MAG: hypothetical protein B6D58_05670 [candidate division Zixibacteria bacterium 4484_95]|nr:MAG: hypothetical protein B6D58_05670 [candidate division Zixibacteria bacterium 4484_95]